MEFLIVFFHRPTKGVGENKIVDDSGEETDQYDYVTVLHIERMWGDHSKEHGNDQQNGEGETILSHDISCNILRICSPWYLNSA